MVDLVLGIGAAVGASTLYSLGIALQAVDAKQAPSEQHLRLALVRNLLTRARGQSEPASLVSRGGLRP